MASRTTVSASSARALTDIVAQLRRALRRSIRTDYPWEARPMAQIEVLQTLRDVRRTRLGDLAGQLKLAQSTVSTLVSQLVDDGLAQRAVDSRDRRASVVELTPAGLAHLKDWDAAHRRRIGAALRAISPHEREQIALALPALAVLVDVLDVQTSNAIAIRSNGNSSVET